MPFSGRHGQSHMEENEDELFYPSPHREALDDRVGEIERRATNITVLSYGLTKYICTHGKIFTDVMSRRINLIRMRSQDLEDGEITVYDKALMRLTGDGKYLQNPAAITFFCEEHLNIRVNNERNPKDVEAEVTKHTMISRKLQGRPVFPQRRAYRAAADCRTDTTIRT